MQTGSSRQSSNDNEPNKSYQKCLDKAFLLLSIRMQTEHELWEKLGKHFEKSDIWEAIARLKELGYVDDIKFANMWVESRSRIRGPGLLRTELIKKGIKKQIIDDVLTIFDKDQQIVSAREAIKSKDKPGLTDEERYKKLGGLLARRGFGYDVIKKALSRDNT